MKKLLSILLALTILSSVFMGIGFTATAEEVDYLAVTTNGVTTNVKVGDTFTLTYNLIDLKLLNTEAVIYFDDSLVEVVDVDEADEDAYYEYIEKTFPVVNASVVCNTNLEGRLRYNFTNINGARFTGEKTLATFDFKALAAGELTLENTIIEMVNTDKEYLVEKVDGQPVKRVDYGYNEFITYVPSEDPTEEPTDAPTEPTDEPTEEPTDAPTEPATEAPTEPATEVPTEPATEAPKPNPIKVDGVTVNDVTKTSMVVSWDEIEGATWYWVYIGDNKIYDKTADTTMTLTGLTVGKAYTVAVTARLADGTYLQYKNADKFPVQTLDYGLSAQAAPGVYSFTINWTAPDATKTWIYLGKSEDSLKIYDSSVTDSYTVMNRDSDTTYYYKLTHKIDGKIIDGESGCVTTLHDELLDVTATYTEDGTVVSWGEAYGSVKYWVTVETEDATRIYSTTATERVIKNVPVGATISVKAKCVVDGVNSMIYYYDTTVV